jgi:hypothetical protein
MMFTTEAQRHRGKPKKGIGKAGSFRAILQVVHRGGGELGDGRVSSFMVGARMKFTTEARRHGEKEVGHRVHGDHQVAHFISLPSAASVSDSRENAAVSHFAAAHFLRFFSVPPCLCGEHSFPGN